MGAMEDIFGENPNRPNSADFWRMSEIILRLDGKAKEAPEGAKAVFEAELANAADPEALAYMSVQRAMRALGIASQREMMVHKDMVAVLATMWCEGFILASNFHKP